MATRTNGRTPAEAIPDLRQFTYDFFTCFGATITKLDRRKQGALRVRLDDGLHAHFGADELILCFQHVDLGSGQELVAYGSRIFDRMMSYLERSSAVTVQQLPQRHRPGDELLQALRPLNAAVAELKLTQGRRRLLVFNWHITYRADDKREELYTVVLDEEGVRLPLANSAQASEHGFDLAAALTDAMAEAAESGEQNEEKDGEKAADLRLPPMTQLARFAETARKYAVYHADMRCAIHEADILPRLHKVLSRLITYYQQQIDEVYDAHDPDFAQRQTLEADLQRKIGEEVENHRLRVGVTLSSYAILAVPVATAAITLQTARQRVPVTVVRNLYDGTLQRPACHVCSQPLHTLAVDKRGHLICNGCLHQCATCGDALCTECGVHGCPVCGRENCDECSVFCWACGERACAEHADRCPTCGDTVCHACQRACVACGTRQCTSHLRLDAVLDAARAPEAEPALICGDCAVRCPGCRQFSAQMVTCTASGQRFCRNCSVACARCGKLVGPGFYHHDPVSGADVCHACVLHCPACGAVTTVEDACAACAAPCCNGCGTRCSACDQLFCREDIALQPCGHALCAADLAACAIGGEFLCPVCGPTCAICGKLHCAEHAAVCAQCHLAYCAHCVNDAQLCASCVELDQGGIDIDLRSEPCVDDPAVAEAAPHYKWRRIDNRRYIIYLGKGLFMSSAVVTVEKSATGGRVIAVRELDLGDLLRTNFWRKK